MYPAEEHGSHLISSQHEHPAEWPHNAEPTCRWWVPFVTSQRARLLPLSQHVFHRCWKSRLWTERSSRRPHKTHTHTHSGPGCSSLLSAVGIETAGVVLKVKGSSHSILFPTFSTSCVASRSINPADLRSGAVRCALEGFNIKQCI